MTKKKHVLIGSVIFFLIAAGLLLTVYLAQQRQIFRGRASGPTGTTFMCLTHPSQTTADCQTPPANFTGNFDSANSTTPLQVKVKNVGTPIAAFYFKLIVPASNINQPTITADPAFDGTSDRWKVIGFQSPACGQAICLVGANYEVAYGVYYDRTDGSLPPIIPNNTTIATITIPAKNAGSTTISFNSEVSKSQMADVNSQDVLFTPLPFTLVLNADTTPPVITFNSGPADNATVSTGDPLTYTYSATDNITPAANIKFVGQFDNTTCPAGTSTAYNSTTTFTTPTFSPGTRTVTVCAKDSSNIVGKATRTLTYLLPPTTLQLKVKFAGMPIGSVTPPATLVASRVVVQDTVSGATHTYKQTFGSNICGVTDNSPALTFTFTNGAYQANVGPLNLGAGKNYEVLVKGPSHLQTKVATGINLTADKVGTIVAVDSTAKPVKGGDILMPNPTNVNSNVDGQNCILDSADLAGLTFLFKDIAGSPTLGHTVRDINQDGLITGDDLALLTFNLTGFEVPDDQ